MQQLKPETPWYGYDLGEWNEHLERQAQRAVKSECWETGKWCAEHRRSDVKMNTEMRTLEGDDRDRETTMAKRPRRRAS